MNRIAVVSYFGGKAQLCEKICNILNCTKHTTYVEPFSGSGVVLLNKNPSDIEIYNDIDEYMVNMFQQIRDNYPEFKRKISRYLYAEKEHDDALLQLKDPVTSGIDKAVAYWYCLDAGFSGLSPFRSNSFGYSKNNNKSLGFFTKLKKIVLIRNRLRNVQILKRDAIELICATDSYDTLFYIDPPYTLDTRVRGNAYNHEIDKEYHVKLHETLLRIRGKFVLSNYESPELLEHYKHCEIIKIHTAASSSLTTRPKKVELLICNFKPSQQLGLL